jgi:hypothetical protein
MDKKTTQPTHAGLQAASAQHETADMLTLARLAGLDRALEHFPDDVATAARTALNIRASFQAPADNTAEVWPVMQVKT